MTRVLGLSGEGELVLALPHADDTRALISGVLVADLKRNIEAVDAARARDGANTVGLLREILRVAKIYEELLSGTKVEEPATEARQTSALRHAEATISTASDEMEPLSPSAASTFQRQRSAEPAADTSTPASASRTRDGNIEAPSQEESDKGATYLAEARELACDDTPSISDVLPVGRVELGSLAAGDTRAIDGHVVSIQYGADQDDSITGHEETYCVALPGIKVQLHEPELEPCCVALPSVGIQQNELGLEPFGNSEIACSVEAVRMAEPHFVMPSSEASSQQKP